MATPSRKFAAWSCLLLSAVSAQTTTFYYFEDDSCPSISSYTINDVNKALNFQSTANPGQGLPNDIDCNLKFIGPANTQLMINFMTFSMQEESNNNGVVTCADYIELTAANSTSSNSPASRAWEAANNATYLPLSSGQTSPQFCGYNNYEKFLPETVITSGNEVSLHIVTNESYRSKGFAFIISPINYSGSDLTTNSNVACNNQLLHIDLVCDGFLNCFDSTDETDRDLICPPVTETLAIGYIIMWVFLSILFVFIGLALVYFVKKRIDYYFLKRDLERMEYKIMTDEGIKREDADVMKHDIFDMM